MSMVDTRSAVRAPGTMSGRLAALAGPVSFVLILISATMLSNAPSAADSGQKILSYLALHHGRLHVGAVLAALAMATALVWAAGLFRALRQAEGGTPGLALAVFGGGVLTAASTVTWALIEGTMATRFTDLGPAGARGLVDDVPAQCGRDAGGPAGRHRGDCHRVPAGAPVPRWFAVASAVLALVSVAGACTIGYTAAGIQVVAGLAIILDGVWILMVSIYLWRDPALTLL